ncbi:hypothetical protein DMI70_15490 [Escherichia coli]|nr:hypothetical protein [Escherichia coli]
MINRFGTTWRRCRNARWIMRRIPVAASVCPAFCALSAKQSG